MKHLTESEQTLLALTDLQWEDYSLCYFETGQEWMLKNAKGWKLWGDPIWESWWKAEWQRLTQQFIDKISIDEDGNSFMVYYEGFGYKQVYDKDVHRRAYIKYMYRLMTQCSANAAVMELSLHRVIKTSIHLIKKS